MGLCTLGPIWLPKACLATCGRFTPFPHAHRENRPFFFEVWVFPRTSAGLCVDRPRQSAGDLQNIPGTPAIQGTHKANGAANFFLYTASVVAEYTCGAQRRSCAFSKFQYAASPGPTAPPRMRLAAISVRVPSSPPIASPPMAAPGVASLRLESRCRQEVPR